MLTFIYKSYIQFLTWAGRKFHEIQFAPHEPSTAKTPTTYLGVNLEELDLQATIIGNTYRGLGILVGILGLLVIFCALAPQGFSLDEEQAHLVHWLEILFMILTVAIFIYGKAAKLHQKWMAVRLASEQKRYEGLLNLIENATDLKAINEVLYQLLDGVNGQIQYNKIKFQQYELIEEVSSLFTWITFVIAFFAAMVHLYFDFPWLTFLTAFSPSLGAVVHGINAFLEIGELSDAHNKMTVFLSTKKNELDKLSKNDMYLLPENLGNYIDLAKQIHNKLTSNNNRWVGIAKKQHLKPV